MDDPEDCSERDSLLLNKKFGEPNGRAPRSASVPPSLRRRSFGPAADSGGAPAAAAPGAAFSGAPDYESLDYEVIESTVYRAEKASQSAVEAVQYTALKWAIFFLIGAVTAIAAFAVNVSVENIAGFKFWATLSLLEKGHVGASFLAYSLMNAALVLAAALVTVYIGPAAAGSGIADVKAYLNGIDVPGVFYLTTLIAKILGSIGAVAGGLAVGKEGPFVHAGACIAALISQGGTASWASPFFNRFWNDRDRKDAVAAGAAAGVAAAFRSPVGGVLFALEEMTSWWRNQLMWLIFFTTAVVSVTVRVLMTACSAHGCGFFGSGGFIIFEIEEGQENYEVYELLPMLLLGVVGGLLGSAFVELNARLHTWRKAKLTRYGRRGKVLEAVAISLLTSAVSFLLPLMFQCLNCPAHEEDCPRHDNAQSGNFVAFACARPNQYNDLATLFFNTQDDAIRNLFSSKTKREYTVSSLVMFITAFYLLAIVTYGVSLPTGLFVPSILCGAAYGRLVGMFVADMHPQHYIDEGTYALLGAASFLGGSMRMTVCTCVMLLELTNNLALLPLIMLVLLVAKAVGDGTGVRPLYEVQMELKGLGFLQPEPDGFLRHITAKECCGEPPVTLARVEKVARIVEVLKATTHNGFPVISAADGERSIMGVVLRQHLLVLLSTRRSFQPSPAPSEVSSRVAITYAVADFSKPMSAPGRDIHDVQLSPDHLELYLDLGPFVNPSVYVVQEDCSLSKVYTLFRNLRLRHLVVIPRAPDVVGIITREDLLPDTISDRFEYGGGQYTTDGVTRNTAHAHTSASIAQSVNPHGQDSSGHGRGDRSNAGSRGPGTPLHGGKGSSSPAYFGSGPGHGGRSMAHAARGSGNLGRLSSTDIGASVGVEHGPGGRAFKSRRGHRQGAATSGTAGPPPSLSNYHSSSGRGTGPAHLGAGGAAVGGAVQGVEMGRAASSGVSRDVAGGAAGLRGRLHGLGGSGTQGGMGSTSTPVQEPSGIGLGIV